MANRGWNGTMSNPEILGVSKPSVVNHTAPYRARLPWIFFTGTILGATLLGRSGEVPPRTWAN
ncbi:MAG: hypothetical protein DWI69_05565 [Chloroflexi bacterium]|nr:MAG: hypothetical protein DWI69_05565 [Chloroflexota bacterium]